MTIPAIRGALFAAIYLVLVGQLSPDEIGLAVALGVLVLGWSLALDRVTQIRFRFTLAALSFIGNALTKLPRAIVEVAPALLRRCRGTIADQPLAHGGASSAEAGWRAAALLAVSLAPDCYALRWAKHNALETHRLSIGVGGEGLES